MQNTYLSFLVFNEHFAINVNKVLEVLEKQPITEVPNTPEIIKGIINFRGEVVPVFDTRLRFNLPQNNIDEPFVIVIIDLSNENEIYRLGAIVDKVKDVITINEQDIKPVPAMNKNFNVDFLEGIVKWENHFLLLMDVGKTFSVNETGVL